ncbi:MAG: Cof-type HAD-IIB family hydrolase [Chlorobi bacterium]|nr:MAG: hydrolase [Chlorobi bacterium OLB7]MBK8911598.1 Cof-type HAD-IIB family hydrolase [Chlorobiota bacterium]
MLNTIARKLFGTGSSDRRLLNARAIICDLDGTLLNRDEMIGAETSAMISALRAAGIAFILATRRHHQAAEPYADLLHLDTPIISLDGAMISLPHQQSPIFTADFDQEFARDILEEIEQTGDAQFCAVTPNHLFVSDVNMPLPVQHHHWNISTVPVRSAAQVQGAIIEVIATGGYHNVNAIYSYVEAKMKKGELKIRLYESRSRHQSWFLEARPSNASKQIAAEHVAASAGFAMKQAIAIGDYYNDVELCRKAGFAVAMQNAVPELKQLADYVTKRSCLDDGIDDFLNILMAARGLQSVIGSQPTEPQQRQRSR